jgi:uncharacterized protein YoxC
MIVQVDLVNLVILLLAVVLTAVLVPMVVQVRRTARQLDQFIDDLHRDLVPMLKELRQASEKLNRASSHTEEGLAQARMLFDSVGEIGHAIHGVNRFLSRDFRRLTRGGAGFLHGARAAARVLFKQPHRGGD